MQIQFHEITRTNTEKKLHQITSDKNALHVLLHSLNLPNHYIIFDGEKYWMFNAMSSNGYRQGLKEYKGHTDYLQLQCWNTSIFYDFPFKVRDISINVQEECDWKWGAYQRRVAAGDITTLKD